MKREYEIKVTAECTNKTFQSNSNLKGGYQNVKCTIDKLQYKIFFSMLSIKCVVNKMASIINLLAIKGLIFLMNKEEFHSYDFRGAMWDFEAISE